MLICHQPFNPQRPARLDPLVKVDVAGFKKEGASGKGLSCVGEVAFYSSFVNMMKAKTTDVSYNIYIFDILHICSYTKDILYIYTYHNGFIYIYIYHITHSVNRKCGDQCI